MTSKTIKYTHTCLFKNTFEGVGNFRNVWDASELFPFLSCLLLLLPDVFLASEREGTEEIYCVIYYIVYCLCICIPVFFVVPCSRLRGLIIVNYILKHFTVVSIILVEVEGKLYFLFGLFERGAEPKTAAKFTFE